MKKMIILAMALIACSFAARADGKKIKRVSTSYSKSGSVSRIDTEYCCGGCTPLHKKPVARKKPAPPPKKESVVVEKVIEKQPIINNIRLVMPESKVAITEHKPCDIVRFYANPRMPKFDERTMLTWKLTGECDENTEINGRTVTQDELFNSSVTTIPIRHETEYTLTVFDANDGRAIKKTLTIMPQARVEIQPYATPSVVECYDCGGRTVGHYLLVIGVPIVGAALLGGGIYALTRPHPVSTTVVTPPPNSNTNSNSGSSTTGSGSPGQITVIP